MSLNVETDNDLIKRLLAGDQSAWRETVDLHHADVYRYLLSLTRSQTEAEDLTQDTFVTFYRRLRRYRGDCSLRTWLHRLAYREFTSFLRKKKSEPDTAPQLPDELSPGLIALLDEISSLPPKLRAAFVLVELQGFTNSEAAKSLRVPQGTIKSRLHRARLALRRALTIEQENTHAEPSPHL